MIFIHSFIYLLIIHHVLLFDLYVVSFTYYGECFPLKIKIATICKFPFQSSNFFYLKFCLQKTNENFFSTIFLIVSQNAKKVNVWEKRFFCEQHKEGLIRLCTHTFRFHCIRREFCVCKNWRQRVAIFSSFRSLDYFGVQLIYTCEIFFSDFFN